MQLTAHLVELDPAPFNFRIGLFDQFAWIIHLNQRALECVSTAVYIYIYICVESFLCKDNRLC